MMQTPDTGARHLLSLPRELRDMIYQEMLSLPPAAPGIPDAKEYLVLTNSGLPRPNVIKLVSPRIHIGRIMLTCRQMADEVRELFAAKAPPGSGRGIWKATITIEETHKPWLIKWDVISCPPSAVRQLVLDLRLKKEQALGQARGWWKHEESGFTSERSRGSKLVGLLELISLVLVRGPAINSGTLLPMRPALEHLRVHIADESGTDLAEANLLNFSPDRSGLCRKVDGLALECHTLIDMLTPFFENSTADSLFADRIKHVTVEGKNKRPHTSALVAADLPGPKTFSELADHGFEWLSDLRLAYLPWSR